ncbi:MAG: helix-turn-helix transcriptional regulator [Synergistaceae bacterium]|nr:helix-turn-helix transcriptional regulator [Synergistaceae bacterium]
MPRWDNSERTPLAQLRANAGLSRNQASVLLDVALNTLGRYETGQSELPLDVAEDMTILYSVPFDDIRTACSSIRKQGKRHPQLSNFILKKESVAS